MSQTSKAVAPSTAEAILDVAESLIQTRGYSAFSYQDIADALDIRKASIHYHFPSKAELGMAVVDRYALRFGGMLDEIVGDPECSSLEMLDRYTQPYLRYARTEDKVCLCGALAGEMMALPSELRTRVARFFRQHQAWLAKIVARGVSRGEFCIEESPERLARLYFAALQGALLVKRTTGDVGQLKDVVAAMRRQLGKE